ncbi:MAG: ATP-binding protein [Chloroflexota bacterium]|nr:ATP-binding protein [Chloroflexota bacterium]MDE2886562.1 ATP-binding protein [Chloroflexota bacterium]
MSDIGYSLSMALADLVDNSITAGATAIHIFATVGESPLRVGVLDDGAGMGEAELLEAMRLGSRSPLEERARSDLGRFGLGLKTASFSQCRALTVVTRAGGVTACARWDRDRVAVSDGWLVEVPDDLESVPWTERLGDTGTLVVWEKLHADSGNGASDRDVADFVRQLDEARSHLELVFHRFLEGGPGHPRTRISLNNRPLEPFDPFHSNHPATIAGPAERIRVEHEHVFVQPFTLPHHGKVTPKEWEHHAGPEGYVKNQGFYVYREKRLIIHGTWFGLARQTELTKLARVRIDMPNSLDAAWKIDIKKASAQLPPAVRDRLRRIIEPLGAASKRTYTTRGRRLIEENRIPVWTRVQNKNQILYRINDEHPMIVGLLSRLPVEACGDLLRIIEVAGTSLPLDALFADLGGGTDSVVSSATSEEALRYAALATFDHLMKTAKSRDDALTIMQVAEPFRSNWQRTVQMLDAANSEEQEDD